MREAFSFRLTPETIWDENIKGSPILSLILAIGPRASIGVLATNEAKTQQLGFVKLTADGFSDSAMLRGVETTCRTLDDFPGSALHNFVVASVHPASQGIHRRLGTNREKHRKPKQVYVSENVIAATLKSQGARRARRQFYPKPRTKGV
jgi:hypothetical protein